MPKKAAATAHPAKRARAKPPQVFDAGLHSCDRGMRFIYAHPVESLAWVLNDQVMKGVCTAKDNRALLAFMKIVLRGGVRQARPVRVRRQPQPVEGVPWRG